MRQRRAADRQNDAAAPSRLLLFGGQPLPRPPARASVPTRAEQNARTLAGSKYPASVRAFARVQLIASALSARRRNSAGSKFPLEIYQT